MMYQCHLHCCICSLFLFDTSSGSELNLTKHHTHTLVFLFYILLKTEALGVDKVASAAQTKAPAVSAGVASEVAIKGAWWHITIVEIL